jgi:hypothetical protein
VRLEVLRVQELGEAVGEILDAVALEPLLPGADRQAPVEALDDGAVAPLNSARLSPWPGKSASLAIADVSSALGLGRRLCCHKHVSGFLHHRSVRFCALRFSAAVEPSFRAQSRRGCPEVGDEFVCFDHGAS